MVYELMSQDLITPSTLIELGGIILVIIFAVIVIEFVMIYIDKATKPFSSDRWYAKLGLVLVVISAVCHVLFPTATFWIILGVAFVISFVVYLRHRKRSRTRV